MTEFPNFEPAECFDERHLPSRCWGCLCGQVVCCLGKGTADPGCPGGLGAVGGGEDRLGRDIAKGQRDHEVFKEETWCRW